MKKAVKKKTVKAKVLKKPKTRMNAHTLKVLSLFKGQKPLSNKSILASMKKFKFDVTSIWVCATICNLHKFKLIKRVGVGTYCRELMLPKRYIGLLK